MMTHEEFTEAWDTYVEGHDDALRDWVVGAHDMTPTFVMAKTKKEALNSFLENNPVNEQTSIYIRLLSQPIARYTVSINKENLL